MKISIIGAGNVGGLLAGRIIDSDLADVVLIDIKENLAKAKAADISDSLYFSKSSKKIFATSDFSQVKDSSIVVITAGFPRKPGMSREDLITKNANLLKDISSQIKPLLEDQIVIIVTNPLDLMAYYFKKLTNIDSKKLIAMGSNLDLARFANLIAEKFNVNINDIAPVVIASHGTEMLPIERLSRISKKPLTELISDEEIADLSRKTIERGAQIVSLYESGSAYFAPSAAILEIIRAIIKDEKKIIYASVYLNGEYGLKDICLGVPIKIGKSGIEQIVDIKLNNKEKLKLLASAESVKSLITKLPSD
jgi:malate dehydrogenase